MAMNIPFHFVLLLPALVLFAEGCASRRGADSVPVPKILRSMPARREAAKKSDKVAPADLERLALENNAEILALRGAVEEARAELGAAVEWRDPELRASYGESDATFTNVFRPDETSEETELTLRFYPPHLWNIRPLRSAARARLYASEADLLQLSWQTVVEVRSLVSEIGFLEGRLALMEESVGLLKQKQKLLKELERQGGATALETVEISSDVFQAKMQAAELRSDLHELRSQLGALTGYSGSADVSRNEKSSAIPAASEISDAGDLADRAAKQRFDLVALAWRAEAAKADRRAETLRKIPSLTHVQVSQGDQDEVSGDEESWAVQAAVEIPIFSLAGRGEERLLKSEEKRLKSELKMRVQQARGEVQMACARVEDSFKTAESMRKDAKTVTRDLDGLAEDDSGSLSALQRIDVLLRGVAVRESVLQAEYHAAAAWHALELAAGGDPLKP